jgi:hypothetical protein
MLRQPTTNRRARRRLPAVSLIAILVALAVTSCNRPAPAKEPAPAPTQPAPAVEQKPANLPGRDLSVDESMGGHTLARHVGKTDEELLQRLRREPQISAASTYTDRASAESVVGAALAAGGRAFDAWRRRTGRRPNFVLHYSANRVIGRSMSRRRSSSEPCEDAVVVLRWDDRRLDFYVLTSYPEANR